MNKTKLLIIGSSICLSISLLSSCSSNVVPQVQPLATTSKSQNYYYCESCPQPTKLVKQDYLTLEPDEPVVEVKPVIVAEPVKPIKRKIKTKKRYKHKPKKNKKPQINRKLQCVQWK